MNSNARQLIKQSGFLFSKKQVFDSLNQEIADNFYPERATFTSQRMFGRDFASHLMSSQPVIMRRELGDSIGTMLRPRAKNWFNLTLEREEEEDHQAKTWLEWATGVQRRAMYDSKSMFTRATKEGDHDYAAFGQNVISLNLNKEQNGLLYRCWHLRDCAWTEDYSGIVNAVYRKWKPTAQQLISMFPKTVHKDVLKCKEKDAHKEINCLHVVLESGNYSEEFKTRYVSVVVDVDNNHILEEVGSHTLQYIVPRWQTESGSQYAYSPATIIALPDARLLQQMTLVLLEAGEKAISPPMLANSEVVRNDLDLSGSGITWVDNFDGNLNDVLRQLNVDSKGIPLGMEMANGITNTLVQSFFINKLNLPPVSSQMTATEVRQRIEEYIRNALPIFEPMEANYNGALCDLTADVLIQNGAFGSVMDMPQSVRGKELKFKYESPLQDAIEREKLEKFREMLMITGEVMQVEPLVIHNIDIQLSYRDAILAGGSPSKWMKDEKVVEGIIAKEVEAQQMQAQAAAMQQAAMTGQQVGNAAQALQGAGL